MIEDITSTPEYRNHIKCLAIGCMNAFKEAAAILGNDLRGNSVISLMCDKMPNEPIFDIKLALPMSGIRAVCSPRIERNIDALVTKQGQAFYASYPDIAGWEHCDTDRARAKKNGFDI